MLGAGAKERAREHRRALRRDARRKILNQGARFRIEDRNDDSALVLEAPERYPLGPSGSEIGPPN